MGLVYKMNQDLLHDFEEGTKLVGSALYDVGKVASSLKLSSLSRNEVKRAIQDLDAMANPYRDDAIAAALAEAAPAIIDAIRLVNAETKAGYEGIYGVGRNLDITWLKGEHVGTTALTNDAATASKGLYGGTSAGVRTWLKSFTAGTTANIVPSQTMAREAALVYIGFIDTIAGVPPVDGVKFTISGNVTGVQPLAFNKVRRYDDIDPAFAKLKVPVLIGPKRTHTVTLYPYLTGDGKPEPLAVLVTMSENLIV